MKTKLLIPFLFCVLNFAGQTTSILKGEQFEHPKKFRLSHPVERDEKGECFFETSGPFADGACLLYKVGSADGKLVFSKEIVFEKRSDFVAAYNKNGKIFLFTKYADNKQDVLCLCVRIFDNKTGNELSESLIVGQLGLDKGRKFERDFEVKFSPDEEKLLIVTEERGKKTAPEINARLLETKNLKTVWEKKAVNVFENSPVYTFNYIVGNDGVFSYLFAFYRSNSETDIAYGIGLVPINNYQNRMIRIPAVNRTIINPKLEYIDKELLCSGEFLEGEDKTKKMKDLKGMGFFLLSIDLSSVEIKTQSFDVLSEELKTKLTYPDRHPYYGVTGVTATHYANKNYRHYQTLTLNGNYYVVRAHSYVLIINGVPTTSNKEILVMKYNKNKDFEWMKFIPRNSYVAGAISSQLNLACTDKLNFFYYDHPNNQQTLSAGYDPKKYKLLVQPTEKTLVLSSINEAGEIQKSPVATETTFFLDEEFEKTFQKNENKIMGRSDTKSKKTRRHDLILIKE